MGWPGVVHRVCSPDPEIRRPLMGTSGKTADTKQGDLSVTGITWGIGGPARIVGD